MDPTSILKEQVEGGQGILQQTMADVSQEQAQWAPPGVANPLGATFAHLMAAQDMFVNGMLQGGSPLMSSTFSGKSGMSEPPPLGGDGFPEWNRRVQVDIQQLREYAQAVQNSTSEWVGSLSTSDLEREIDMTNIGFGKQNVGWVLANVVVWHINAHCGEISCLKGLQGAKGYPF